MKLTIELGRWVAAVFVVCFHVSMVLEHRPFGGFFRVGSHGVDYFFVLSGFLMFHLYRRRFGRGGTRQFLLKRVIRIYFPYWVVLGAFLAVLPFRPDISRFPMTAKEIGLAVLLLPRHTMPPAVNADFPLIIPSWTLTCELLFYAFIALCLALPRAFSRLAAWVWPLTCLAIGLAGITLVGPWRFVLPGFVPLFFLGAAAESVTARLPRWSGVPLLALGLSLFIALGYYPDGIELAPPWMHNYVFALLSVLMVSGLIVWEADRPIAGASLWLLLGSCSYAIYLTHYPALQILGPQLYSALRGHSANVMFLVMVSCYVAIGSLFYYLIERHVLKFGRQLLLGNRSRRIDDLDPVRVI